MSDPRVMDLVYWITERYAIKLRKDNNDGPPWTGDPNMANVRYCNVHREDDKVTKWFRKNWNSWDDPAWKFVLGRMINYVPTLESMALHSEIIDDADGTDLAGIKEGLKALRSTGVKIFTSVYTISTCGKSMDKIDYVVDWVVAEVRKLEDRRPFDYISLEETHKNLTTVDGLGQFLSAQVIADMKNTTGHPLVSAPDWWSWCASGPGSIKGLAAFFPGRNITPKNFHENFKECRALVDPLVPDYIPSIHAQDFQNCLCEFSKYMRVKNENGHVRNKYRSVA